MSFESEKLQFLAKWSIKQNKQGKVREVMELLASNSALMMQRSLDFLWQKQTCMLENISNVETPGYRTKYVTFEESLRNAIVSSARDGISTSAIRRAIEDTPVTEHVAESSTRMDDNGVDILEQQVELARNGYQMQYVIEAISSDFSLLQTAIRG